MYYFYKEKKEEVLKGRTIKYLSYLMGITEGYISRILNGKIGCSRLVALCVSYIGGNENLYYYFKKGE